MSLAFPLVQLFDSFYVVNALKSNGVEQATELYGIATGSVHTLINVPSVIGVAIATVVSQGTSAVLSCMVMFKSDGYAKIDKTNLRIDKSVMFKMLEIGAPIALSKCLFSFANVLVSAELNSLGETAMAAQSITKEFDGVILEVAHGIGAATIAVVSQNYGAKKMDRIKNVLLLSFLIQLM